MLVMKYVHDYHHKVTNTHLTLSSNIPHCRGVLIIEIFVAYCDNMETGKDYILSNLIHGLKLLMLRLQLSVTCSGRGRAK